MTLYRVLQNKMQIILESTVVDRIEESQDITILDQKYKNKVYIYYSNDSLVYTTFALHNNKIINELFCLETLCMYTLV